MIDTVLTYCNANSSAFGSIPAVAGVIAAIQVKLDQIHQLNQIALTGTKGVTKDSLATRKTMTDLAYKCSNSLCALANVNEDTILLAKVNFTYTHLVRLKKEEIHSICQSIHNEAHANIAQAANYGYTPTDVTNLQSAITAYLATIQSPRIAIVTRSQAIRQMKELANFIVNRHFKLGLDLMSNTLIISNPNFISGYKKARKTINLGSTHAKIRGIVQAPEGTILPDVNIYITKTGQYQIILQTTSNSKGRFSLTPILPDNYDLHFQLLGRIPHTETNLHIPAGKEFLRKITLSLEPPQ